MEAQLVAQLVVFFRGFFFSPIELFLYLLVGTSRIKNQNSFYSFVFDPTGRDFQSVPLGLPLPLQAPLVASSQCCPPGPSKGTYFCTKHPTPVDHHFLIRRVDRLTCLFKQTTRKHWPRFTTIPPQPNRQLKSSSTQS